MSRPLPDCPRPLGQVRADARWQRIDFLSDVHLHADEADTAAAWRHYLQHTSADALFILGDLFEVWIGDDDTDPFAQGCVAALADASQRLPVFFVCGNRDFLAGAQLMQASGMQALDDPTVLDLGAVRFLLSHGDRLCLDDTDYLAFRAQVRSPAWQAAFLAQPLSQRMALARALRQQSEQHKQTQTRWADVDADAARHWLRSASAQVLVHGHTHQPQVHDLGDGLQRWVLSDWHAQATPPRLEITTWQRQAVGNGHHGLSRHPLSV